MLSDFRNDPDSFPLETPSGRIEIFSETIDSFGYQDCPGHPVWMEPVEWLRSEKTESFPLHLISNQPTSRLHSQLDNSARLRKHKIRGREVVVLHPEDAATRGIEDGDIVRVFNKRGECLAGARVSEGVRHSVVQMPTGAWYDPEPREGLAAVCKHGNPNTLTLDKGTSKLAQGPSALSCLVEVARYEGEVPDVTAFTPPKTEERRDG
jgi:biotin/methionine sulfoxide reductase